MLMGVHAQKKGKAKQRKHGMQGCCVGSWAHTCAFNFTARRRDVRWHRQSKLQGGGGREGGYLLNPHLRHRGAHLHPTEGEG